MPFSPRSPDRYSIVAARHTAAPAGWRSLAVLAIATVGLGAALGAARTSAGAQPAAPSATQAAAADVSVHDANGRAVAGAQVSLTPARTQPGILIGRSGVTGDDGRVRLPGLPAGRATLAVRRLGFSPQSRDVTLPPASAGVPPALDIVLTPVPVQLASVTVSARRRGPYTGRMADFNRRRDMGFGTFLTAADIEERHPLRTTDMLRMIPGAAVSSGFGTSRVRLRNSGCDPLVWIDGAPAMSGWLDIDAFDPRSLAGIEVYKGAATVPVELRGSPMSGGGSCGVIALWTRVPEPTGRRGKNPPVTAEMLARLVESATVYTADQVEEAARVDTAEAIDLRYPEELRRARVGGDALVEFVVDTAGRVESETIGVVAASHPELAQAAREAARGARFIPARRAGRPVRQLAQLPLRWEPR